MKHREEALVGRALTTGMTIEEDAKKPADAKAHDDALKKKGTAVA